MGDVEGHEVRAPHGAGHGNAESGGIREERDEDLHRSLMADKARDGGGSYDLRRRELPHVHDLGYVIISATPVGNRDTFDPRS